MKHQRYNGAVPLVSMALAGCVSFGAPEMISLGTHTFDAAKERQTIELPGGITEAVALRPIDSDARCLRASAQLSNGDTWDMFIGAGGNVRQGETRWMAVPRPWQNPLLGVLELQFVCYSAGPGPLTVEILASEITAAQLAQLGIAARN
jgi:hypothetical protein